MLAGSEVGITADVGCGVGDGSTISTVAVGESVGVCSSTEASSVGDCVMVGAASSVAAQLGVCVGSNSDGATKGPSWRGRLQFDNKNREIK